MVRSFRGNGRNHNGTSSSRERHDYARHQSSNTAIATELLAQRGSAVPELGPLLRTQRRSVGLSCLRFGRKSYEQIIDCRRSIVGFAPDSIFAFVRWAANEHGTVVSRIDIARAVRRGEPFQTLPYIRPGGEILLRLDGWPRVQRALAAIDAVEALGSDPADASPDHWRHVHNRLTANLEPHAYTPVRHAAWLHRRRIGP